MFPWSFLYSYISINIKLKEIFVREAKWGTILELFKKLTGRRES